MKLSPHFRAWTTPLVLAAALATGLSAQSNTQRVGITSQAPSLLTQDDLCQTKVCGLAIAPIGAGATAAGGTAFDGTTNGVWVSNGVELALVMPGLCRELCAPTRPLPAGVFVTGLAVYEPGRQLILTDSSNSIQLFDLACPIQRPTAVCSAASVIPGNHTIGGVAVDDVTGDIYFSSSDFSTPQNPGNLLWVSNVKDPCKVQCMARVPDCAGTPLVPIHGVAFEGCTSSVWLTDGFRQLALRVDTRTCSVQLKTCCTTGVTDPLAGLCILPSQPVLAGGGCVAAPCRNCPNPIQQRTGTQLLGNSSFAIRGANLPTGSVAALLLGAGACQPPGITLPQWCGPLVVPFGPPPLLLGPVPVTGSTFCDGAATVPLPIPRNPSLCGAVFCSQLLGVCAGTPTNGTWITQAVQWRVDWL